MLSGQSANDIQVLSGGTAQIDSGATVSGGELGGLYVVVGIATSVTIESGGQVLLPPGARTSARPSTLAGVEVVSAGGTTIGATLNGGDAAGFTAELFVSAGGIAIGMTVDSGGYDFDYRLGE